MFLLSQRYLPILMITPSDDALCAIEARRAGVFDYLVKTPGYLDVLGLAINETITKFDSVEELKRTIASQQDRIAGMEKELRQARRGAGAPP